MAEKQTYIVSIAICLALLFTGCGSNPASVSESTTNSFGTVTDTKDDVTPEVQVSQEANASELGTSQPEISETPEVEVTSVEKEPYPEVEEILTYINNGESKMYWCADTPSYTGTMDIQPVTIPDENDFTSELSNILGEKYNVSVNTEVSGIITVSSADGSSNTSEILSALSQVTGTEYTSITPEEIYTEEYVPVLNGYSVDAEGCFPSGGANPIPGPCVCVLANGKVDIRNPLIMSGEKKSIDISELVSPETVKTICKGYYESQIDGYVAIIERIDLEYYYSESGKSILPAWYCEMTFYRDENGHSDSILVDAQTGELLRK